MHSEMLAASGNPSLQDQLIVHRAPSPSESAAKDDNKLIYSDFEKDIAGVSLLHHCQVASKTGRS